jgi:dTDP-glucose pyrophosphorylase
MKNYFIDHKSKTRNAILKINKVGGRSIIVVKNNKILKGILSGYDLRKAIINKTILNRNINNIYNKKPKFIYEDELKKKNLDIYFNKKKFTAIPVVKKKTLEIVDILTAKKAKIINFKKFQKINCSVVIMAGGKGTRMKPYTEILPKPLLPIGNKSAIRHIIENFHLYKPKNFYISVNYKSGILKTYLNEIRKKFKINLINEKKPLGTAGSLFFLKNKIKGDFFLTNCDTIISSNLSTIFKYHKKNNNDITLITTKKSFSVPYGVCKFKKKKFNFEEKPTFNFNINTGLYLINPNILNLLKKPQHLDFNHLLSLAEKNNKKINFYQIKGKEWSDVGQIEKLKKFTEK